MDNPLNGGFICELHEVGYISECPTCASIKNPPKQSKKQAKMMRQVLRNKGRR